jgi:hypothetical protein
MISTAYMAQRSTLPSSLKTSTKPSVGHLTTTAMPSVSQTKFGKFDKTQEEMFLYILKHLDGENPDTFFKLKGAKSVIVVNEGMPVHEIRPGTEYLIHDFKHGFFGSIVPKLTHIFSSIDPLYIPEKTRLQVHCSDIILEKAASSGPNAKDTKGPVFTYNGNEYPSKEDFDLSIKTILNYFKPDPKHPLENQFKKIYGMDYSKD